MSLPVHTTSVVLVDDHPALRAGVRTVLEHAAGIDVIGEAGTAAQARVVLSTMAPDVILLDIGLPDTDGISLLGEIRRSGCMAKIVILSCQTDEMSVRLAVDGGASGYITKTTDPREIVDAVRKVQNGQVALSADAATHLVSAVRGQRRAGEPTLTAREREVWRALAQGLSNAEIARSLFLSEHTVKFHIHNLLGKLGLKSRSEAMCAAHKRGMLSLD
jgi:DNA-binding NarL/FixJ family response regulator